MIFNYLTINITHYCNYNTQNKTLTVINPENIIPGTTYQLFNSSGLLLKQGALNGNAIQVENLMGMYVFKSQQKNETADIQKIAII